MYNSHHYPGVYQEISFLGIIISNTVHSILNLIHNFGSAIIQVISLSRSLTKDIIFIWAKLHRELLENRLCYNSLFWGDQDHPPQQINVSWRMLTFFYRICFVRQLGNDLCFSEDINHVTLHCYRWCSPIEWHQQVLLFSVFSGVTVTWG